MHEGCALNVESVYEHILVCSYVGDAPCIHAYSMCISCLRHGLASIVLHARQHPRALSKSLAPHHADTIGGKLDLDSSEVQGVMVQVEDS